MKPIIEGCVLDNIPQAIGNIACETDEAIIEIANLLAIRDNRVNEANYNCAVAALRELSARRDASYEYHYERRYLEICALNPNRE